MAPCKTSYARHHGCVLTIFRSASRPLLVAAAWLALAAAPARAGLADTPLPKFLDGKQSQLVLRVPGVVRRDRLETVFLCTSLTNTVVDIGVEVFDAAGTLLNDVHAGNGTVLGVAPGETVTLATSTTATYAETELIAITGPLQGSARIVASSAGVRCNVLVVDELVSPPVSLATLGEGVEPQAGARPGNVALPQFSDGHQATHAALFPGIIHRGDIETAILCTSLASQVIDIGVELLNPDGTVANSIAAGSGAVIGVQPGSTVTIATTGTASLLETDVINLPAVAQGLARVVSDSAALTCTAIVLDAALALPESMTTTAANAVTSPGYPHPLPQFSDGKSSQAVLQVPGVMKRDSLQTLFLCTSLAAAPVDIGVEIFGMDGTLLNDVHAGVGVVLDVGPGETVTIATSTTPAYVESTIIPLANGVQGFGRVVASSSQVLCDAIVADDLTVPPRTLARLGAAVQPRTGALPPSAALPEFSDGHAATHAAYFPGLIKRGHAETDIFCTSVAAADIDIGVQVFRPDGTVANDLHSGNGAVLAVPSGATVVIGTTGTAALLESTVITLAGIAQGMARVVADSKNLLCSAMVLDAGASPPAAMSALVGYGGAVVEPQCGNGAVEGSEECDDSDMSWSQGQACDESCMLVACGDPNNSDSLSAPDALFVLRAAVGLEACDSCVCNVDGSTGDNPVSASDALRVLRKAVGVNIALDCPACAF